MAKVVPPNGRPAKVSDRQLMLRAIDLSRKCRSEPGRISPKVGAIVARDNALTREAKRARKSKAAVARDAVARYLEDVRDSRDAAAVKKHGERS